MKRAAAAVLASMRGASSDPTVRSAGAVRFTNNTQAAGFDLSPDIGGHHGSYVADYDDDGDDDIFMTAHGIGQADDTGWNVLFRNRGNGIFDEVAGSPRQAGQTGGAAPVAGVDLYGRDHPQPQQPVPVHPLRPDALSVRVLRPGRDLLPRGHSRLPSPDGRAVHGMEPGRDHPGLRPGRRRGRARGVRVQHCRASPLGERRQRVLLERGGGPITPRRRHRAQLRGHGRRGQ